MPLKVRTLLLLVILIIFLNLHQCEKYATPYNGKYGKIRQIFPKQNVVKSDELMGANMDTSNYNFHPCKRKCYDNSTTTCYYYLIVHYDETFASSCLKYVQNKYIFTSAGQQYIDQMALQKDMSQNAAYDDCKYIDGIGKDIMVVNGQFPSATIEVCEGDIIVADVINSMLESTTMHWHGMHQLASPHMDGVPHITQYPIESGQAFRYRFTADHAGTNWWHSHTGHQRNFGLAGALVVRQSQQKNPHARLYDFDLTEHVIMLEDWTDDYVDGIPFQLLINGHGRRNMAPQVGALRPTMYSTFSVKRGGRYRFRVISNGITNCPLSLSIDQHDLVIIASDGNDVEPLTVQKLSIHGGERYDFVLNANQPIDNYWLRLKGYAYCENHQLFQEAILSYVGSKRASLPSARISYGYERSGLDLNAALVANPPPQQLNLAFTMSRLRGTKGLLHGDQILTYYTQIYLNSTVDQIFQIDRITFTMGDISLLQTRNLGNSRVFCNKTTMALSGRNCREEICRCANIIQVPAYRNVEFVISAVTFSTHPIHLHGYSFEVVGMGIIGADRIEMIEQMDKENPLPRRTANAPIKDTVQVPSYGYTILRFYTNNPGYWIMHCHISTHSENGMSVVLSVGIPKQMRLCPLSNCGLCSSVF